MIIGIDEILENIAEAFESLDGTEIEKIHNDICDKKVIYQGDNTWQILKLIAQITMEG